MKSNKFQERFYRDWINSKDLVRTRFIDKQTDILVSTDKSPDSDWVKQKISCYRGQIESYIIENREFLTFLEPISIEKDAPDIVKDMGKFSKSVNVGPMASVAGAISEYIGRDLLKESKEVIVENGGDIFIKTNSKRRIGLYAGESEFSKRIFLEIKPKKNPFGICASSGTVGHSLSFGIADVVVILANSAILADAAATAIGNLIKGSQDLNKAIDFAKSIKGITGIVIVVGATLSAWGDLELSKE